VVQLISYVLYDERFIGES